MNKLNILFISLIICFSCKSNKKPIISGSEYSSIDNKLPQTFTLHSKMVVVASNGQDVRAFEITSKTLDGPQVDTEYKLSLDQVYLHRYQLYDLLENDANTVFLANDLSLKSKSTFQRFQGCYQFLLPHLSHGLSYSADLILVTFQRELTVSDADHYGVICIENNVVSFDFRSDISSKDASEILANTIFADKGEKYSAKESDYGYGKKLSDAQDVMLPFQYRPLFYDQMLNDSVENSEQLEVEDLVTTIKTSGDGGLITDSIDAMNYYQTLLFFRKFISDSDLHSHKFTAEMRRTIENNLIKKIHSGKGTILPHPEVTPSVASGGYMTPINASRYMEYLSSVHGVETKFSDTSFRFYEQIDDVLVSLRTSLKDKEVFITQLEGSKQRYVISINHTKKTIALANGGGHFYREQVDELKAKLMNKLGPSYKIGELALATKFIPKGCGLFCVNLATKLAGANVVKLSVDLLIFTQSSSRMKALDGVREFMESDALRKSANRIQVYDDYVRNLGLELAYKNAHKEAMMIVDDPAFRIYVNPALRDQIARGEDFQFIDLIIRNLEGRWPNIDQELETHLKQKIEGLRTGNSSSGKEEARLAMFELLRRAISKASNAEQQMLLWQSYRPLAEKLPEDKILSDRIFAVQMADGQSLNFPQYFSLQRDYQKTNLADQYAQFLLWLSLKADKLPGELRSLKLER